jgi:hypothetical protein
MLHANPAELKALQIKEKFQNLATATLSPFNNKLGIAVHANCAYQKRYTEVGEVFRSKRRIGVH